MFEALLQRHPGSPLVQIVYHEGARALVALTFSMLFRARSYHAERIPQTGPLIIAANHQSFVDPPFIGTCCRPRHLDYIARASLFRFKPFGWLLESVNCVPLKDESGDAGAIREVLRRLELGHAVMIFPEGNRTRDGAMHRFKRGLMLLVRRAECPVIPVAVEGCFDAWPRHSVLPVPWTSPIAAMFGHPVAHEELVREDGDSALRRLECEIDEMRLELRRKIRMATRGMFP